MCKQTDTPKQRNTMFLELKRSILPRFHWISSPNTKLMITVTRQNFVDCTRAVVANGIYI